MKKKLITKLKSSICNKDFSILKCLYEKKKNIRFLIKDFLKKKNRGILTNSIWFFIKDPIFNKGPFDKNSWFFFNSYKILKSGFLLKYLKKKS